MTDLEAFHVLAIAIQDHLPQATLHPGTNWHKFIWKIAPYISKAANDEVSKYKLENPHMLWTKISNEET